MGMGVAARYALGLGMKPIRERARGLAAELRSMLDGIDGVQVLDRAECELSAIVTVAVDGWRPEELAEVLRTRGLNSTGQRREDAVIDYDHKGVDGALRLSPHYYNTEEEVAKAVRLVEEVARVLP